MYCEKCGKEITGTGKFCTGCGAPIPQIIELKQPEVATLEQPEIVVPEQPEVVVPEEQEIVVSKQPEVAIPEQPEMVAATVENPSQPVQNQQWTQMPQNQQVQYQQVPQGQPMQYQQPKKKTKIWIPFVIGGAVLAIGLLICFCLFFIKPKLEKLEGENAKPTATEDKIDIDEIIEDTLGIEKIEKTSFDLAYSEGKNESGEDAIVLSAPESYGYVNYQYMDFDGDKEKEILVVSLEKDGSESYFSLHMLEKIDKGWKLADSENKYDEEYFSETAAVLCPERCDVYIGEVDGLPVIYVENEYVGTYFSDGVGISLYQLSYKEEAFCFGPEPLHMAGSDVDYILSLDKETAIEREELEYFEKFEKHFKEFGLKVEDGMYYSTPLFIQNSDLTYVAGYNKYATFSYDDVYNWLVNDATGELDGVVFEVADSYLKSYGWKETQTNENAGNTTSTEGDWKKAYYDYLLSKDLGGYSGYSLLYVNDDEIPELYLYGNCEAAGQIYATYSNGKVVEQQLGRLGSIYAERQNFIINSDGNMGYYYDIVYTIQDGAFVKVHEGTNNEMYDGAGQIVMDSAGNILMEYTWDGQKVTAQEYQSNLAAITAGKYTIQPEIQYKTSGDIITYLQGGQVVSTGSEYIFSDSSSAYLTEAQVAAMTKEELRLARNEIYARHGYIFNKEDLKNYFESKSWYVGTTTETIGDENLNAFEIANRDLIARYENQF